MISGRTRASIYGCMSTETTSISSIQAGSCDKNVAIILKFEFLGARVLRWEIYCLFLNQ